MATPRWFQACQTAMMKLFGQTVRRLPALPTREEQLLRARLMFEEAGIEMIKASGCKLQYALTDGRILELDLDRLSVELGDEEADVVEVADAIADGLVVTFGAANTYGLDAERIYAEVHRSNMSKVWPDGTIHKREDGKVLKPETYSPANLRQVIEDQYHENLDKFNRDADTVIEAMTEDDLPQNCDDEGRFDDGLC